MCCIVIAKGTPVYKFKNFLSFHRRFCQDSILTKHCTLQTPNCILSVNVVNIIDFQTSQRLVPLPWGCSLLLYPGVISHFFWGGGPRAPTRRFCVSLESTPIIFVFGQFQSKWSRVWLVVFGGVSLKRQGFLVLWWLFLRFTWLYQRTTRLVTVVVSDCVKYLSILYGKL